MHIFRKEADADRFIADVSRSHHCYCDKVKIPATRKYPEGAWLVEIQPGPPKPPMSARERFQRGVDLTEGSVRPVFLYYVDAMGNLREPAHAVLGYDSGRRHVTACGASLSTSEHHRERIEDTKLCAMCRTAMRVPNVT